MKKDITANVPLEFIGVSEAVKSGQGMLVKVLHDIEITSLPEHMPQSLDVDISKLVTLEDNILISDIVVPKNVTIENDLDEVVAAISAVHEEKEEEEAPLDLSAIEVEKKGKKEDEA